VPAVDGQAGHVVAPYLLIRCLTAFLTYREDVGPARILPSPRIQ
jgi:hypothetical protein